MRLMKPAHVFRLSHGDHLAQFSAVDFLLDKRVKRRITQDVANFHLAIELFAQFVNAAAFLRRFRNWFFQKKVIS